jgi:hypothetical protein
MLTKSSGMFSVIYFYDSNLPFLIKAINANPIDFFDYGFFTMRNVPPLPQSVDGVSDNVAPSASRASIVMV